MMGCRSAVLGCIGTARTGSTLNFVKSLLSVVIDEALVLRGDRYEFKSFAIELFQLLYSVTRKIANNVQDFEIQFADVLTHWRRDAIDDGVIDVILILEHMVNVLREAYLLASRL